jgi:Cellulase (glycosyl hydrolase family 5)
LVIAITIPITTNTTIATCNQIHVGDMTSRRLPAARGAGAAPTRAAGGAGASRGYRVVVRVASILAKRSIGLAALLCALAWPAGTGAAGAPARARAANASLLGGVTIPSATVVSVPGEADAAVAVARQLHAQIVRIEVSWSAMEPGGPGQIDPRVLAYADRAVADAAADGIRMMMLVQGTPCWASSAPASLLRRCVPGHASKANSWPPSDDGDFAAFVAYLAARYGSRLAAIEIWNEPDQANEAYFAGPHKAERYAQLVRAAYPAIKQVNPGVQVLAGALVGSNGEFLRAMYAAGIKGYYDGLAVHYYNLTLASLRSIHEVQLANGDDTPLWLNEFGWSSCWPRRRIEQEQGCVTAQVQAANIANIFRALRQMPYVAGAVLYKLRDSRREEFGVLAADGAHKPAFAALARALASSSQGPVSRATVRLSRRRSQVVASGSGPVGDFMELEAFRHGVARYRAFFTLNRFNRYSIALPAVLGTSGLQVHVHQYGEFGAGPRHDAQASI